MMVAYDYLARLETFFYLARVSLSTSASFFTYVVTLLVSIVSRAGVPGEQILVIEQGQAKLV